MGRKHENNTWIRIIYIFGLTFKLHCTAQTRSFVQQSDHSAHKPKYFCFHLSPWHRFKMASNSRHQFSIPDYVVFSLMLAVSAAIGIWYGCGPGGKQKTTREYLLADRKMKIWPVAISLLVSYLSAITLLGVPSEIYTYGAQYYVLILSYFLICGVAGLVFVPMFHRMKLTCVNEVRTHGRTLYEVQWQCICIKIIDVSACSSFICI